MPSKSVRSIVQEMPFERKLVLVGALLLVVSAFLPWYVDRDSFNTGDLYLGITGPLSLLGLTLLVLGGLNIALLVLESSGKKLPLLSGKNSSVYLFSGIASFYLLLLATSVYFHQKFGLNITMKQSQFGMFFSFIAAAFLTVGGYLAGRDRASALQQFQQDTATQAHESSLVTGAPTASHSERDKPKGNLRKGSESDVQHDVPVGAPMGSVRDNAQKNQPSFEEFKRMVGVGRDMNDDAPVHVSRHDEPIRHDEPDKSSPQPLRTDL